MIQQHCTGSSNSIMECSGSTNCNIWHLANVQTSKQQIKKNFKWMRCSTCLVYLPRFTVSWRHFYLDCTTQQLIDPTYRSYTVGVVASWKNNGTGTIIFPTTTNGSFYYSCNCSHWMYFICPSRSLGVVINPITHHQSHAMIHDHHPSRLHPRKQVDTG